VKRKDRVNVERGWPIIWGKKKSVPEEGVSDVKIYTGDYGYIAEKRMLKSGCIEKKKKGGGVRSTRRGTWGEEKKKKNWKRIDNYLKLSQQHKKDGRDSSVGERPEVWTRIFIFNERGKGERKIENYHIP